ncbi:MAG TPA: uracil-DNA glycosylase [Candidatus Binatia bacterium]
MSPLDPLIARQAKAWLEREIGLGLDVVPRAPAGPRARAGDALQSPVTRAPSPAEAPSRAAEAPLPGEAASFVAASSPSPGSSLSEVLVEPAIREASSLPALREVLGDCRRCKLCRGRTNIVFGVGNPSASLMFVGEGPGEDEDRLGEPFVGKAGALLDSIITNAMGLSRSDVYIANVVKCRPPNNRDPEPDEIVACEPFLRRQVELVSPQVIVSLGKFATQALLGDRTPISKRRGRWHEFNGVPLMPTFHPAYLLRNPADKRLVWEDIKLVMARLGLVRPSR